MVNRRLPRRRVVIEEAPAGEQPQDEPELIIHHDDDDQLPPLNVPLLPAVPVANAQAVNIQAAAPVEVGEIVNQLIIELQRRGLLAGLAGLNQVGAMNPAGLNPIINPIPPVIAFPPAGIIQPAIPIQPAGLNPIAVRQHQLAANNMDVVIQGRYRAKDPPEFSGGSQNVNEWLAEYEDIADFNQWSQEARRLHVKVWLTGIAKQWYRSHIQPQDWPGFRKELTAAFSRFGYVEEQRQKLSSRHQGYKENVMDYCYNVIYLCSIVNPMMTEQEKVKYLIEGLQSSVVEAIFPFLPMGPTVSQILDEIKVNQRSKTAALRGRLGSKPTDAGASTSTQSQDAVTKDDLLALKGDLLHQVRKLQVRTVETADRRSHQYDLRRRQRTPERSEYTNDTRPKADEKRYFKVEQEPPKIQADRYKKYRWDTDGRPICSNCDEPGHLFRSCRKPGGGLKRKADDEVSAGPEPKKRDDGAGTSSSIQSGNVKRRT